MSKFCHFYGYTPTEYRALSLEDFGAMAEWMIEELKRRREAQS